MAAVEQFLDCNTCTELVQEIRISQIVTHHISGTLECLCVCLRASVFYVRSMHASMCDCLCVHVYSNSLVD